MIARLIRWSIANRFLVLLASIALAVGGVVSMRATPVDALPDLSDVQVIVRTTWPGQAPQIVEDQVTYPLATTMLSVPGAKVVRGYSFFGDSFVYILFDDATDLYWARSRVLEYLNQVQARLPEGARPALGPDATGVGWIYQYALVDRSGAHDLSELRALQDWFLRYELKALPDVAEVATVGGMVRQYQVVLDPGRMRAHRITHGEVIEALRNANGEAGGAVLELAEAEVMVRASGYLKSLDDLRVVPVRTGADGVPVTVGELARVQLGPEMRRGLAELDGEGEVVGGVIVMRSGKNARATIAAVKARLDQLREGLPPGVEIVETYDRSQLIQRAVDNLSGKLVEEFIVVALVCALFLFHLRSALVAVIALPLGVLAAFTVMRWQGLNANILSLGGIAIAIGAMVDAAIVMIENAHKHIEAARVSLSRHPPAIPPPPSWCGLFPLPPQCGEGRGGGARRPTAPPPQPSPTRGEGARRGALEVDRRRRRGSRARAVLQPADHHPVLHPGVHAAGPGRPSVRAAGLDQDLGDGRGRGPFGDAGAGADGLLDPRADSRRARQPDLACVDRDLPAAARRGAGMAEGHAGAGRAAAARERVALCAPRRRVPSAHGRRRPAVHAHRAARPVRGQGRADPAADRPDDPLGAGGRARVRQDRPRRHRHRSGADGDDRDHHPLQAARSVAPRHDPGEAGRGTRRDRAPARPRQPVDPADPQPHRHAGDRDQEPDRGQGQRARPGWHRRASRHGSSRWPRACRASPRRWPSA